MNPINILLVEDNEGDILLTTEALEDWKVLNKVDVVRDGESAIEYLNKTNSFQSVFTPDLILLDVNIPKKNGHEVLQHIKSTEKLKHIPVIMFTTSSSPMDILLSYRNHANCYIAKPVEVSDYIQAISKIEEFWFSIAKLPN
jgi:CheY-like chemotaxis protein